MTKVVVAYHSGYGHTEKLAEAVHKGASDAGATAALLNVETIDDMGWGMLADADAIIFGAPTYMGSLSGPFKIFMDASSKPWFTLAWKDKIAGGFTNSGSLSGDKLNSLIQLAIFGAQHGMIWVGNAEASKDKGPDDVNRIGSWLGLMAQSENAPASETPPSGDLKTAELYGARIASIAKKLS